MNLKKLLLPLLSVSLLAAPVSTGYAAEAETEQGSSQDNLREILFIIIAVPTPVSQQRMKTAETRYTISGPLRHPAPEEAAPRIFPPVTVGSDRFLNIAL